MDSHPRRVSLRGRHTAWVRAIRSTDAVELQRAFALLSDLSRYRRFLTGTPHLTDQQAAFFSEVDHVSHEALVALPEERGSDIVGVARFIRYSAVPTDADLAITVTDAWHDRGLASALLSLLSERAREVGVRRFVIDALTDNAPVQGLLRNAGLVGTGSTGDVTSGYLDLVAKG
jgi:acetyltransferase